MKDVTGYRRKMLLLCDELKKNKQTDVLWKFARISTGLNNYNLFAKNIIQVFERYRQNDAY